MINGLASSSSWDSSLWRWTDVVNGEYKCLDRTFRMPALPEKPANSDAAISLGGNVDNITLKMAIPRRTAVSKYSRVQLSSQLVFSLSMLVQCLKMVKIFISKNFNDYFFYHFHFIINPRRKTTRNFNMSVRLCLSVAS